MIVEYISNRPNGFPVTHRLALLKCDFSNFSVCPLTTQKIGAQLYLPDPQNSYAVALEKPAVKQVARLHNLITSCQSSKVFIGFKFVGDVTISS